ncbi:hypothetical protein BJ742DRAFT_743199 [Cladochytrium replicatum]|nr:hypothetical protein BJ742DRAFT_743199 [Cladochytrium replicatum]
MSSSSSKVSGFTSAAPAADEEGWSSSKAGMSSRAMKPAFAGERGGESWGEERKEGDLKMSWTVRRRDCGDAIWERVRMPRRDGEEEVDDGAGRTAVVSRSSVDMRDGSGEIAVAEVESAEAVEKAGGESDCEAGSSLREEKRWSGEDEKHSIVVERDGDGVDHGTAEGKSECEASGQKNFTPVESARGDCEHWYWYWYGKFWNIIQIAGDIVV